MPQTKKLRSGSFTATVTPTSIEKKNTKKGVRYSCLTGASIARKGRETIVRTAMAFGPENASIARSLRVGKPVDLICQFDGGTVRLLGKAPKAAKAANA
jgi:hypothetical protein